MAADVADNITYFLRIKEENLKLLGTIRLWDNLEIGLEKPYFWVKGFTEKQIELQEISCIPFKALFYSQNGKLFQLNSILPDRTIPSIDWLPVRKGLPPEMPSLNHHYFGVEASIRIKLVFEEAEKELVVMRVSNDTLGKYIETAPSIRLRQLSWVKLSDTDALLFGKPLLSLQGEVFWRSGDFIIPGGYNFELPVLSEKLNNIINPLFDHWIIWKEDATYFKINKNLLRPLSRSSFRLSNAII